VSLTKLVRSSSNGVPSVAVCSGIVEIEGGMSTSSTVIRKRTGTAAATPSVMLIVTSWAPTSSSPGVPEISAGGVKVSQLGSVGAEIVGVVSSGSVAASVNRYVTPSSTVSDDGAFVAYGGSLTAVTVIVTVAGALCVAPSLARYVKVVVPLKFGSGV
jgi:hypothetical protein